MTSREKLKRNLERYWLSLEQSGWHRAVIRAQLRRPYGGKYYDVDLFNAIPRL